MSLRDIVTWKESILPESFSYSPAPYCWRSEWPISSSPAPSLLHFNINRELLNTKSPKHSLALLQRVTLWCFGIWDYAAWNSTFHFLYLVPKISSELHFYAWIPQAFCPYFSRILSFFLKDMCHPYRIPANRSSTVSTTYCLPLSCPLSGHNLYEINSKCNIFSPIPKFQLPTKSF